MKKTLTAIATAAALLVAGCGSESGSNGGESGAAATDYQGTAGQVTPGPAPLDGDTGFLSALGLEGAGAPEVVKGLETTSADRDAGIVGSVRYDHIVFNTPAGEHTLQLPEGQFYVSIAPFVDQTHECYYHNLATCQGELVEEDLDVTITADDGEVLVDETVKTYQNGFAGFWLPRDIEGTIEISYDGKSVTAPLATGPEDPTCVTTLQLT